MAKRESISNSFTVNSVQDGARGKTGRFYYYATVWNTNDTSQTFSANDAQTPYFKVGSDYYVYIGSASFNDRTMAQIQSAYGTPSSSNANWSIMYEDFKYIITEAIFGAFAKFGSAVINGDWMLSTCGIIYDTSDGAHTIDANTSWGNYNINNAYTYFSSSYPNSSQPSAVNFCPAWCVDLKQGKSYENDAYIKGQVVATSGAIGGFHIDNEELRVGDNADWTNPQTNHPYTLLGKGRSRFLNDDGNSLIQVSFGLNSEADNSRRALTVIRNDKSNNYTNSPAVEIRHITSYGSIGLRVQTGVSVFQEGIIPFSDFHYVDGNITLSGLYGNSIFFKGSNGTHQVTLPTYTEILNSLTYGMPSNVFALELTLATHIGSSTIEIKMPSGGYIMDYNGNIVNSITITSGKYVKLMLVYDGTTYYAQKVYASYDM